MMNTIRQDISSVQNRSILQILSDYCSWQEVDLNMHF
jgi:hypothetical protein